MDGGLIVCRVGEGHDRQKYDLIMSSEEVGLWGA
jgi:hypothetical protein